MTTRPESPRRDRGSHPEHVGPRRHLPPLGPVGLRRTDRPASPRRRTLLGVVAAMVLVLAAACSDAPTEQEIAKADDGVNPSVMSIFVPELLDPTVQQLGTSFLLTHQGITFQYTSDTSDNLAQRVRDGFRPTLWIDDRAVLAPFADDPAAVGPPAPVGDDPLEFIILAANADATQTPTLEAFGAAPSPFKSGLCVETLPCGAAAKAVLDQAGIVPDADVVATSATGVVTGVEKQVIDVALAYRSDTARLVSLFSVIPLPDPNTGRVVFESQRFSHIAIAEEFQTWIQSSPDAEAILRKNGFFPQTGPRTP